MARVAIVVPVTRAQSLVQTHQPVHAVMVNKMAEQALSVEVRLKINCFIRNAVKIKEGIYSLGGWEARLDEEGIHFFLFLNKKSYQLFNKKFIYNRSNY